MKLNLYQSYYKVEQLDYLDPICIPYDNTANLYPDLREYPQMKAVRELAKNDGDEYWGLISWKFYQKCLIHPTEFKNWIRKNPGYDCYFVNPCFINEALFPNSWVQGEMWHKGIIKMASDGLIKKYPGLNQQALTYMLMPSDRLPYCNYVVGNDLFWNNFFLFVDEYFDIVSRDTDLKARVYSSASYNGDKKVSNFIFLVERLLPTFLCLAQGQIKTLDYQYQAYQVSDKVEPETFIELSCMSDIKSRAFYKNDQDLMFAWQYYQKSFMGRYPNILSKE